MQGSLHRLQLSMADKNTILHSFAGLVGTVVELGDLMTIVQHPSSAADVSEWTFTRFATACTQCRAANTDGGISGAAGIGAVRATAGRCVLKFAREVLIWLKSPCSNAWQRRRPPTSSQLLRPGASAERQTLPYLELLDHYGFSGCRGRGGLLKKLLRSSCSLTLLGAVSSLLN